MKVDFYSPEFVEDPYPTYARLRAESPVFFDPDWDLTFFAGHRDVSAILKDRRFGRDVRHAMPAEVVDAEVYRRIYPPQWPQWTKFIRGSFIDLEPPDHTRIRRLVQWAFTRRASESYRPRMEEVAEGLLEAALAKGEMEAISEFATPIPLTLIAELLGIPGEDQPQLIDWSHAIVRVFDQGCTEEEGDAAERAVVEFADYLRRLLARRRLDPADDLVTALLQAEHNGDRLGEDELIATCILTLNAGHEATVQAVGNGLLALARLPDQYARLRAEPVLMETAVDELLRFDSPLQMFERWVLEDTEWRGEQLRRGSKVGLLFGSANHDELVFSKPEEFDPARTNNPHVSFGGGVHYCVGAPLAKVELDVALRTFVRRVAWLELAEARLPRLPSLVFRGVQKLPLRIY
jgi:cytochrome P450